LAHPFPDLSSGMPTMRRPHRSILLAALAWIPVACAPEPPSLEGEGEGGAAWLSGTVEERFQSVGDQLGGFSQTMLEVGLRHGELHWAVEDGNWRLAEYQTEKIGDAIERGIVRRPGRASSARDLFLDGPLPAFREALESRDEERIRSSFRELTAACNACHVAEDMEFVVVGQPPARTTTVQPLGRDR
jgi:hypothetical protein